jgi:DNA polymerase III subunit delta
MTAVKTQDIDRFVAKPTAPIVLVHGPDAGLVRERVDALIKVSVDDPTDPFSVAKIESEELSANPGKLADEANTVPLFGGRRAVLLKISSRHNVLPSIEAVLDNPPKDCRVIIEAGDLKKNAPIRAACEKSKSAAAIPCYTDKKQDLERLIEQEMGDAGLTIAPDARAALLELLGGDRLASRSEIRKLLAYAAGQSRIELADVTAVVSDASEFAADGVVDAAFAGQLADLEREYTKARAEGANAGAILVRAVWQVTQFHKMRLSMDAGADAEMAMMRSGPPVHFSRKARVGATLNLWSSRRLAKAIQQLGDALLDTRKQADLGDAIAHRAFLSLAVSAKRRD